LSEYPCSQMTVTDNQGLRNTSHCVIYLTDTVFDDTDEDGMTDNRETAYFGTLDKNGDGDEDGDGISDGILISIDGFTSPSLILFKDKKSFMRIFSKNIDDNQLALGMYDPKKVLSLTFQCSEKNMNIMSFVRNRDAMRELGQCYPFNELTDFLNEIKRSEEE